MAEMDQIKHVNHMEDSNTCRCRNLSSFPSVKNANHDLKLADMPWYEII